MTLAKVDFTSYQDAFSAIGTGVAEKSVSLISEVSGQIKQVMFDGTQEVKKGDILIQLDDESERINVDIAKTPIWPRPSTVLSAIRPCSSATVELVTAVTMKAG